MVVYMKYVTALFVMFCYQASFANQCVDEMSNFTISEGKKDQICNSFSDPEAFKKFKSCIFSTVKMYDKSLSDESIYSLPESEIQGVLNLCAGFRVTGSTDKSKEKKLRVPANVR